MSSMSLSLIVSMIDQYSAGASKFKQTLTGMRDQARQIGRGLKDGIASELYPRFDVDAFDKNVKTMEGRVSQARSRLMGAAGQLLVLATPVKLAADFDQSFKMVEKVVDAPRKKLTELRKFALDTSALIPVAARDILDLMSAAAQGGVPVADLERFTTFVARMAVAADMAGGEIGQIFAETRNTYKLTQEGIEALGDSANHLSNSMATSARKIFEFTGRAAGGASILKWTAVQMNAVGASLTAVGIVPETAARGFNTFATKLLTGGKKVDSAFKSVGLSRIKVLADVRARGPQAFAEFIELLSTKGDKGASALADIVGLDFADDFNKLLANPEILKQALSLINDPASFKGSALAEAQKMSEGAQAQFQKLKNQLTRAAIVVGEQLLPPLLKVATAIGAIADQVAAWGAANPELFSTIVQVVAGLILMSAAMKVLSFVWAVSGLQLFKFLGLFMRFNKAGRNVSIAARAVRGLGAAIRGLSPLRWARLIPKLSWLLFVPKFAWKAVIAPLSWFGLRVIPAIGWAALAGLLKWRVLVKPLSWSALRVIPSIGWATLAGALKWSTLIKPLSWFALRVIPGIGWAALAGELAWHWLIKPLDWDEFLNLDALKAYWNDATSWIEKKWNQLTAKLKLPDWLSAGDGETSNETAISVRPDQRNDALDTILTNLDEDQQPSGPSRRLGPRRQPGQVPVPRARPAPAGAIPVPRPFSMDEALGEMSQIMQAFTKGGQAAGDAVDAGGDKAAEAIRRAGPESGTALGQAAGGALRSQAAAIGAEMGRAAVAQLRSATVNVRVQGGPHPASQPRARSSRPAALHDGGDE